MQGPPAVAQLIGGPAGVPRGVPVVQAIPVQGAPPAPAAGKRLNHKKLHVTMAALEVNEVSNEDVLAMARTRGNLLEYSIGDELHPQPADPTRPRHKHFYLKYEVAINHRDARYCTLFDMQGRGGRTLHPHIQGVGPSKRDRANVIYYTQKDGLYIASNHLTNFDAEATDAGWAVEMNQVETVRDGMLALQQRHPQMFYMHGARVQHGLEMRIGHSEPSQFALADFTCAPLDLSVAHVLQGASHIGKTQFALAHFKYPLLVSELDDLKCISLRTDGLVFDQMRFVHPEDHSKLNMNGDQIIKLLDMEVERSVGARYQNARIPRSMPRIFTTNRRVTHGEPIFPRGVNPAEQEGIDSRVRVSEWMADDIRRNPAPNARGGAQARVQV